MILKAFPDLQWLKQKAETGFPDKERPEAAKSGWPSVILNVTPGTEIYRNDIKGPLSVFTNLTGKSEVVVDGRRYLINDGFYFVSNQGQYYTLEIDPRFKTETFNIHFGESFLDHLMAAYVKKHEFLLDNHLASGDQQTSHLLYNRLNCRNSSLTEALGRLKALPDLTTLQLEEELTKIAASLLDDELDLSPLQHRLCVVKSATRQEIFKRLLAAVDYIYSFYAKEITLDDLAAVSCLSKFHFLRLFKTVYHTTPSSFIEALRVRKAKEQLVKQNVDVTKLAASLGYKNASSFSRMFRNHTGRYPTQFLQASR